MEIQLKNTIKNLKDRFKSRRDLAKEIIAWKVRQDKIPRLKY